MIAPLVQVVAAPAIKPQSVRYIKLGHAGGWEKECLADGKIRFGFQTATAERYPLAVTGRWADLTQSFIDAGKDRGTATRFTNETRLFFGDTGSTLWITFHGATLYWGFTVPDVPVRHPDGDGVYRHISGGWRSTDRNGELLTVDRLAGSLTKLVGYRGTTCRVDVSDYVVRRINGIKSPEIEQALSALTQMRSSANDLIRLLEPRDFETHVDLVFTTSGWRRQGPVGGTQKTRDMDIILPSTNERAFVQVKSRTSSAELLSYVAQLDERGPYDRMFYVFHTGEAAIDDPRVNVIGPEKLAQLVVDAGLVDWLVRKVS